MKNVKIAVLSCLVGSVIAVQAFAAGSWQKRGGDLQNTGNAGDDAGLPFSALSKLGPVHTIATDGIVNATPVINDDQLLVVGDWAGYVYVVDVSQVTYPVLVKLATPATGHKPSPPGNAVQNVTNEFGDYIGIQSTATLATVTLADGSEEKRAYIGVNNAAKTMFCLNLSAIAAARATLANDPGDRFFCAGNDSTGAPAWPRSLAADGPTGNGTFNGSPMFSKAQHVKMNGVDQIRDVIYTPSTGLDCANGQFYAVDALTGETLWSFDPVPNGTGGTIWTTPAMNRDRTLVYITTGDCVSQPQTGAKAESLIALDAADGHVVWFHQRRLADTADLDVGNGPVVADVGLGYGILEPACNVVVSSDKDGCMYGFNQQADIPEVGDIGFDPLRQGEQRLLWRKCFVPGSLNGGFNAGTPAFDGRFVVQQTSGYPAGHVGADDCNVFAVNACTGETLWCSSSIPNGRTDAAIVNGFLFQIGGTMKGSPCGLDASNTAPAEVCGTTQGTSDYPYTVFREVDVAMMNDGSTYPYPTLLSTVQLPAQPSLGGGGPAIVNGRIYVPTLAGIVVVAPTTGTTPIPIHRGDDLFLGPYLEPVAPNAGTVPPVDANHPPYPLLIDSTLQRYGQYRN